MKIVSIAALAALSLSACQQPADTTALVAGDPAKPASAAAAVDRVGDMPVLARCGTDAPGPAKPMLSHAVDLGGRTIAVLMDCPQQSNFPTKQTVHVIGPDGVLKSQTLLIYNGAGYDADYTWGATSAAPVTWDAAASQLVSVYTQPASSAGDGQPAVKASEATVRWRWAGDRFAMVSSTHAVQETPRSPFVVDATWPGTPPIADPTTPPEPVAPQA